MRISLVLCLALLSAAPAAAQVLITEVQPNPAGAGGMDTGEWIEVHNTGTASVSIAGWTLSDYVGTMPANQSTTRWAFPAGAGLAAGQVIVVARQAAAFSANYPAAAVAYELADGANDPGVPDLAPTMGTTTIQLGNAATGDAVVLADAMGTTVNAVEWGTVDRSVAGIPLSATPGEGASLVRVGVSGSSNMDFVVTTSPTPGVGFSMDVGPIISSTRQRPAHLGYASTFDVRSTITSSAALRTVEIRLATATSSGGAAGQDYLAVAMTATQTMSPFDYRFSAPTSALAAGLGFADPLTFHDRYVRVYVSAEDVQNRVNTDPAGADEASTNAAYYTKNVMPSAPSTIQAVREQTANQAARWLGHSVTVRGVALAPPGIITANRYDLPIEDDSGFGLRAFANAPGMLPMVSVGDRVEVIGTVGQFRGVVQLGGADISVTAIGGTGPTVTTTVTLAQLIQDAERLESRLVLVRDLDFSAPTATWPDGNNVTVRDATGEITVRITNANELAGAPAPQYGFAMVGVVGQFTADASGTTGGYQLFPRGAADITAKPMPPQPDAGVVDTGMTGGSDAGSNPRADAGGTTTPGGIEEETGCSCHEVGVPHAHAEAPLFFLALLAGGLYLLRGRSRR